MKYICKDCHHQGKPKSIMPGSFLVELGFWILFGIIGILFFLPLLLVPFIYSIWRIAARKKGCPQCGGKMIPADSPLGKQLVKN